MRFKKECHEIRKDKRIVLQENKMQFIIDNSQRKAVEIIEVDHCQIKGHQIRCDYMAIINEIEYYIELKGQDIKHAIEQIEATIKILSLNSKKLNKKSYIISARCPLTSTRIQKLKKDFKRKYNSHLHIKNRKHIETI